ncbi:TPA: hypothetical protein ACX3DJ_004287 [Vibrio parahaemolyticus]|nr:hypothetical protein [Vibrio parahaemolyticus]
MSIITVRAGTHRRLADRQPKTTPQGAKRRWTLPSEAAKHAITQRKEHFREKKITT